MSNLNTAFNSALMVIGIWTHSRCLIGTGRESIPFCVSSFLWQAFKILAESFTCASLRSRQLFCGCGVVPFLLGKSPY